MQHAKEKRKPPSTYSARTVWIHWVTALLISIQIYTGITMEHQVVSPQKFFLYQLHFASGAVVFLLTIIRIIALINDAKPNALYPLKSARERLRKVVYYGFYTVLVWMSVSGLISLGLEGILPALKTGNWVNLPEINADGFHPIMLSHHIIAKLVFLLLLFHVIGFLTHLIQKKENTLKRIWFK